MNRRSHPVRLLMDHLAIGGQLTPEDLAHLRLADHVDRHAVERSISDAARRIAAARLEGQRGIARQIAKEVADAIISAGADTIPDPDDTPTDPRALAALIRQR
ncbi:MAG: hypothetical protein R2697_19160 [Ilumatobacteraceae bacterium]